MVVDGNAAASCSDSSRLMGCDEPGWTTQHYLGTQLCDHFYHVKLRLDYDISTLRQSTDTTLPLSLSCSVVGDEALPVPLKYEMNDKMTGLI